MDVGITLAFNRGKKVERGIAINIGESKKSTFKEEITTCQQRSIFYICSKKIVSKPADLI
jgi:hypothetical protein